jgi:steroid delta-isomerase-like uncharacterized protein
VSTARPSTDYDALIRGHIDECLNQNDWSNAKRYYWPDIVVHHPAMGESVHGIDGFRRLADVARAGFPDIHWEIVDLFGAWSDDREKTAVRFRVTGTHTGEFVGFPPTGRSFATDEMSIGHLADGRVKEIWVIPELTSQMRQLGLIPEGPPPKAMLAIMRTMERLKKRSG